VLLAGALGACGGGGGNASTKRHTTTTSTTATSTTTTTLPATTTSTQLTTTTAAGPHPCSTPQLSASFGMVDAGLGNRYVRLRFTNTSGAPCTLSGFVGLQLVGAQPIPTNVVHSQDAPVTVVSVAPGAPASSLLHWGAIPGANEPQSGPCEPTPTQMRVSVPNQAAPLVVGWSFGPVCQQGQFFVGALQAGPGQP
jgi:hypothetical protein